MDWQCPTKVQSRVILALCPGSPESLAAWTSDWPRLDSLHPLNSGWQENESWNRSSQFFAILQAGNMIRIDDPCKEIATAALGWVSFEHCQYYNQYDALVSGPVTHFQCLSLTSMKWNENDFFHLERSQSSPKLYIETLQKNYTRILLYITSIKSIPLSTNLTGC